VALSLAVKLQARGSWPTPLARDCRGPQRGGNAQGGMSLSEAVRRWMRPALWPTPNASVTNDRETPETFRARQAALKAKGYNGNGAGVPLTIAVLEAERRPWPTPTARDWRSGRASEATHARNSRPLSEAVCRAERPAPWPTPTASEATRMRLRVSPNQTHLTVMARIHSGTSAPAAPSGAVPSGVPPLNPDWTEQLMGFELGWTDGPPAPPSPSTGGRRRASRRRPPAAPTG
jgi:hypothetical protein